MEGSEPTLVPEWLRCTGRLNQNGGGSSTHHFASSSSQSDALSSINSSRNRPSRSINDKDSPRFPFLDRTTSSNSRHSSSTNGSAKHPYSSFSRSHRDKNREKEKERSTIKDIWDHDCSDPLGSILSSRVENIALRRSQSLVSRKPSDAIPRRIADSKNSGNNFNKSAANGMHNKVSFEKDFPSLGAEEKQGVPEIGRVPSPNLSSSVHSLPIGNPGLIGGEGWTSALAEVPAIMGTPNSVHSSVQQNAVATPASVVSSSSSVGLNMAEALSQAPSRARTTPQVPDKTQRLEELAIKQSRQLIPMTPSMPKPLVVSSSDKLKQPKIAIRTSEATPALKSGPHHLHQQPTQTQPNQSVVRGGGQIRNDSPKSATSSSHVSKFQVLKPLWENHNNNNNGLIASTTTTAPKDPPLPGPPPNPQPSTTPLGPKLSTLEKKHSLSLAQSRTDFFNLMRKKSSSSANSSLATTNNSGKEEGVVSAPVSPRVVGENGGLKTATVENNSNSEEVEKNVFVNGGEVYPDEEEAAFLRSLGWEENGDGEDEEGLTEEEINAFIQEYKKLKPSLKVCRGVQLKFEMLGDSCPSSSGISASSEVSFSGSKAEA